MKTEEVVLIGGGGLIAILLLSSLSKKATTVVKKPSVATGTSGESDAIYAALDSVGVLGSIFGNADTSTAQSVYTAGDASVNIGPPLAPSSPVTLASAPYVPVSSSDFGDVLGDSSDDSGLDF